MFGAYLGVKKREMDTHLICHAHKGKSLMHKYMEDMPFLCVRNTAARKSRKLVGASVDHIATHSWYAAPFNRCVCVCVCVCVSTIDHNVLQ